MKKLLIGAAIAATMCSSFAFAADDAAAPILSGNAVILSDCSLLADDVTPSLSNGVLGSYNCKTGLNSTVLIATCHTNGRTASRTVETPCVVGANAANGEVECADPAVSVNTATAEGAAIFVGSTSGGAIGPAALDGSVCDAAAVAAKTP